MIIRVQSDIGTRRIEVEPTETSSSLMAKVQSIFELPGLSSFNVYKNRDKSDAILALERKKVSEYGLKHGDIVYLVFVESSSGDQGSGGTPTTPTKPTNGSSTKEDEVDIQLWKMRGLIERPRDERFCRHGANAKCVHCLPIEPYDEGYIREHNIKHMSFHAYLRKLTSGIDKGKFAVLENISCKIKPGCKDHPPYPAGVCGKCRPSAVTLNRQVYRHVDNVVFENAAIVKKFLDYYYATGHQRIGFLYGRYEPHSDVPLGIKATVVAIYEPPQESSRDYVNLTLPDPNEDLVNRIASELGLTFVGWIFTDLIAEDMKLGTVRNLRNADTHFLSAQEVVMAGHFQNAHPNPCRLSPDGYFGSKSVTVIVTGKENQVHTEGYQVSNQGMALVRDDCLVPTKDAPELGYIREGTRQQYVPDVFFKEKDKFGNEVSKIGRPLPLEYLLVDVPASSPVEPRYTFATLPEKRPFPVENRFLDGQIQDFDALKTYMSQFTTDTFLEAVSDFHLLIYVANMEMLPFRDSLGPLLGAIKDRDRQRAILWQEQCEHWATLQQLIQHSGSTPSRPVPVPEVVPPPGPVQPPPQPLPAAEEIKWNCGYCTFENPQNNVNCEMCGLPK